MCISLSTECNVLRYVIRWHLDDWGDWLLPHWASRDPIGNGREPTIVLNCTQCKPKIVLKVLFIMHIVLKLCIVQAPGCSPCSLTTRATNWCSLTVKKLQSEPTLFWKLLYLHARTHYNYSMHCNDGLNHNVQKISQYCSCSPGLHALSPRATNWCSFIYVYMLFFMSLMICSSAVLKYWHIMLAILEKLLCISQIFQSLNRMARNNLQAFNLLYRRVSYFSQDLKVVP